MVIIDGDKWACDICIRGHRVSSCQHIDKPLKKIKPKGRPSSQCAHCRENRKKNMVHTKCLCGSKNHQSECPCADNVSKCTCSKRKSSHSATTTTTAKGIQKQAVVESTARRAEPRRLLNTVKARFQSQSSLDLAERGRTASVELSVPAVVEHHDPFTEVTTETSNEVSTNFNTDLHADLNNPLDPLASVMGFDMPPTPEASESSPISEQYIPTTTMSRAPLNHNTHNHNHNQSESESPVTLLDTARSSASVDPLAAYQDPAVSFMTLGLSMDTTNINTTSASNSTTDTSTTPITTSSSQTPAHIATHLATNFVDQADTLSASVAASLAIVQTEPPTCTALCSLFKENPHLVDNPPQPMATTSLKQNQNLSSAQLTPALSSVSSPSFGQQVQVQVQSHPLSSSHKDTNVNIWTAPFSDTNTDSNMDLTLSSSLLSEQPQAPQPQAQLQAQLQAQAIRTMQHRDFIDATGNETSDFPVDWNHFQNSNWPENSVYVDISQGNMS